jgi:DNA mismatch repair protein MutL
MAKIKQLSHHEAQKIAAGEVVERPANIVKELVENSIDAGATRISIYIEESGKKLIRIVDNGCGMDNADALICFDRHATSKITRVDELESIDTFGFRGEALASIAAVSQITLITKEEQSLEGTQVIVEANSITATHSVACTTGTDISVHNLFFNVPARKKFLKAPQTEWRAIQLLFNAFCFDYPHIHFTLFADGKQVHNCPVAQNIKNRALQLWESATHKHLLDIAIDGDISLHGVVSDHQQYRYDRSSIYFFVNKRWVKNQHLGSALLKGYANVIPHGRYPIAAINITVPAHEVDINIHPRKEEVKFLHPRRVEQALQQAIKAALEGNLSQHLKREVSFKPAPTYSQPSRDFTSSFNFDATFSQPMQRTTQTFVPAPTPHISVTVTPQLIVPHDNPFPLDDTETPLIETNAPETIHMSADSYRLIGQYKTTYLLVEKEDGLFLVDQHAAHERILYELFSERFADVATIQLLFPQVVTLSPHDIDLITPHLDIFSSNGIIIEQYSHDQLIVQSLPVHLKEQSLSDLIKEVISWIVEYKSPDVHDFKKTINNKLQAQMACKAAVKAGDVLTQEKMEQLLRDLEKTANRFSCPHGRPTGWLISLSEIEKKFRRRL